MAMKQQWLIKNAMAESALEDDHDDDDHHLGRVNLQKLFMGQFIYYYSLDRGVLLLSSESRAQLSVEERHVELSQSSPVCFGSSHLSTLLSKVVGFDSAMLNIAVDVFGESGHFVSGDAREMPAPMDLHSIWKFHVQSGKSVGTGSASSSASSSASASAAELASSSSSSSSSIVSTVMSSRLWKALVFKLGVFFTSFFLFFVATSLVSLTLKSTQEKMMRFTYFLQYYVRHRIPYLHLVVTHVVDSLIFVPIMIGIQYFLVEFLSDQLLAFMTLSLVWMAEVYAVLR